MLFHTLEFFDDENDNDGDGDNGNDNLMMADDEGLTQVTQWQILGDNQG